METNQIEIDRYNGNALSVASLNSFSLLLSRLNCTYSVVSSCILAIAAISLMMVAMSATSTRPSPFTSVFFTTNFIVAGCDLS